MGLLVDDITERLVAAGTVEGLTGWKVARAHRPDAPDQVVVLTPYGGDPSAPNRAARLDRPGLQVLTRSVDRAAAEAKAYDVRAVLDEPASPEFVAGGTRYLRVEAQQQPAHLEIDSAGRHIFVTNYICWR